MTALTRGLASKGAGVKDVPWAVLFPLECMLWFEKRFLSAKLYSLLLQRGGGIAGPCLQILDFTLRGQRLKLWDPHCLHFKAKAVSAIMNSENDELKKTVTGQNASIQARLKEVTSALPMATAWEHLWKEGVTPWDVKGVTPVISHLLQENKIREGLALVPGCGSGYDVVAMASPTRRVIGLDISKTVVELARERAALSPNSEFIEIQNADFFTYAPPVKFDVIFDYTFFCAMKPSLRPEWAKKMAELLASDGELITLMFPVGDYEGGPPYAVSLEAYMKVLQPWAFKVLSVDDNIPSVPPRKGFESLVRWAKMTANF
ncbi:hypothetical protein O6H91_03G022900 [Diphasiastrum complanatum]|nr:hypothetical protein O6H91_03G022900 [Diphasiastrum complanatum]